MKGSSLWREISFWVKNDEPKEIETDHNVPGQHPTRIGVSRRELPRTAASDASRV
jgi:hypothetical protein